MIPIQDAVPSGKIPLVTIALVVVNTIGFAMQSLGWLPSTVLALSPFSHATGVQCFVTVLFLWIFGDNVEARLGRRLFAALYGLCGTAGACVALTSAAGRSIPLGAACGVSGVLGAYFVLLPTSRVLTLIPAPTLLTEIPAPFFLALWWLLQFATLAIAPGAPLSLLGPLIAAFAAGAALCLITKRPVVWE